MLVGYARTSTVEQHAGLDAQVRELEAIPCPKIFQEQVSSVAERSKLEAALDFVREGDTLVVTKLDRLARSMAHLVDIVSLLKRKSVSLRILQLGLDTETATGQLMLNIFGAVAQFERQIMLERQREGIAKASADGKYKGRKPTAMAKSAEVIRLKDEGVGATDIARMAGIGIASVYRILKHANANKSSGRSGAEIGERIPG